MYYARTRLPRSAVRPAPVSVTAPEETADAQMPPIPVADHTERAAPPASQNVLQRVTTSRPVSAPQTEETQENRTGLPDALKSGVESLSGLSLDDVEVHRDSDRPAQVGALAYTQGAEIHIAPGQEQHLAHEVWHAVQQKQGRVKPTLQAKGLPVNDDDALEREADSMPARLPPVRTTPGMANQWGAHKQTLLPTVGAPIQMRQIATQLPVGNMSALKAAVADAFGSSKETHSIRINKLVSTYNLLDNQEMEMKSGTSAKGNILKTKLGYLANIKGIMEEKKDWGDKAALVGKLANEIAREEGDVQTRWAAINAAATAAPTGARDAAKVGGQATESKMDPDEAKATVKPAMLSAMNIAANKTAESQGPDAQDQGLEPEVKLRMAEDHAAFDVGPLLEELASFATDVTRYNPTNIAINRGILILAGVAKIGLGIANIATLGAASVITMPLGMLVDMASEGAKAGLSDDSGSGGLAASGSAAKGGVRMAISHTTGSGAAGAASGMGMVTPIAGGAVSIGMGAKDLHTAYKGVTLSPEERGYLLAWKHDALAMRAKFATKSKELNAALARTKSPAIAQILAQITLADVELVKFGAWVDEIMGKAQPAEEKKAG